MKEWCPLSLEEKILILTTASFQVSTFADMEGEETFDSSFLGSADEVVEERIADDDVIMIKGTKNSSAVCLLSSMICLRFTSFAKFNAHYGPLACSDLFPPFSCYIFVVLFSFSFLLLFQLSDATFERWRH